MEHWATAKMRSPVLLFYFHSGFDALEHLTLEQWRMRGWGSLDLTFFPFEHFDI
jgi:hypothetical protein